VYLRPLHPSGGIGGGTAPICLSRPGSPSTVPATQRPTAPPPNWLSWNRCMTILHNGASCCLTLWQGPDLVKDGLDGASCGRPCCLPAPKQCPPTCPAFQCCHHSRRCGCLSCPSRTGQAGSHWLRGSTSSSSSSSSSSGCGSVVVAAAVKVEVVERTQQRLKNALKEPKARCHQDNMPIHQSHSPPRHQNQLQQRSLLLSRTPQ